MGNVPTDGDEKFLCGVAVSVYQNSGDELAQWANFQQKKLFPFNVRLQLSGSDVKGDADTVEAGVADQGSDHDIQEMVSQSIAEGQEEAEDSASSAKDAAGSKIRSQAAAAENDSEKKDKILDKLKHELDKRLDHDKDAEQDKSVKAEAKQEKKEQENDNPEIEYKLRTKGVQVGQSSDFWNNYEIDIKLAQDIGSNSFRISIEWSRIMPQQGVIDDEAVQRYHDMLECIHRCGMEPNITLHWFAHPQWFSDLGEFTKEENIALFEDWTKFAFTNYGKYAKLWATFNEPEVACLCGHIMGNHPPGKRMQFKGAGQKLCNMLRAHAAAYKVIKSLPGGNEVSVGLVHNVWWMEPKKKGPLYRHIEMLTETANHLWGNEALMGYLQKGEFTYKYPWGKVEYQDPDGKPGCDFFGINHYARGVLDWNMAPSSKINKVLMADMGYPIDPHSLYKAIAWSSQLGLPMYVMENGAPFDKDDTRRTEWINCALEQVKTAVRDGYDLRGYHYWTLLDNFEWSFAYDLKFGLYEWDRDDPAGKRTLRDGAKVIKGWYAALPGEMQQVRQQLNGKPRRMDRNLLPQDSPTPAEACAYRQPAATPRHRLATHPCRVGSRQIRHPVSRVSHMQYSLCTKRV